MRMRNIKSIIKHEATAILVLAALLSSTVAPLATADQTSSTGRYTIDTSLRHNPEVSGGRIDEFIEGVHPDSPLVGLGKTWVSVGLKHDIDPVYLMAHAILESGWGFSWISLNKKNLYGWGAYDRDPEGLAHTSSGYEENIEYVASHIKSMYLTPGGEYYTGYGPTLRGMNVHYATSRTWASNIASIMNMFAESIPGYLYPGNQRDYDAVYIPVDIPTTLYPGRTYQLVVKVLNIGRLNWPKDSAFALEYSFGDNGGREGYVTAGTMPVDVAQGEEVLLTFPMTSPVAAGSHTLRFDMNNRGVTTFSGRGVPTLDVSVTVREPDSFYTGTYSGGFAGAAFAGSSYPVTTTVTNESGSVWEGTLVSLGYKWIDVRTGDVALSETNAGAIRGTVTSGEAVVIGMDIRTPSLPGTYVLKQDMVGDGPMWFSSRGTPSTSTLVDILPDFGAVYRVLDDGQPNLPSAPRTILVTVMNTSRMTWPQNGYVKLAYSLTDSGGQESNNGLVPMPQDVSPGENVTVPVTIDVPAASGTHILSLDLLYETIGRFSAQGVPTFATPFVVSPDCRVLYGSIELEPLRAGAVSAAHVTLTNTSEMVWPADGYVKLTYSFTDRGAHEGYSSGVPLPKTVKPGASVTVDLPVSAPQAVGVYQLRFDMKYEGYTWFSKQGMCVPSQAVVVGWR